MRIGSILLILGLLLIGTSFLIPLAVTQPLPTGIVYTNPLSEDVGKPDVIPLATKSHVATYIRDPEGVVDSVVCHISTAAGQPYSESLILQEAGDAWVDPDPKNRDYIYAYSAEWNTPEFKGTILKFLFQALNVDGNAVYQRTTYGKLDELSEGYFTINGEKIDANTTMIQVYNPTLTIEFHATKSGENIVSVEIIVLKEDKILDQIALTETVANNLWRGTYNLPTMGTYTLSGQIEIANRRYSERMRILIMYGQGGDRGFRLNYLSISGIALIVVGFVLNMRKVKRR